MFIHYIQTDVLYDKFFLIPGIIGQKEEKNNNLSKLFKLYEEGIKHYPDSQIIYSNLGAHLFR